MKRALAFSLFLAACGMTLLTLFALLHREDAGRGSKAPVTPAGPEASSFDEGTRKLTSGDLPGSLADLDRAVQMRPDWAEAYYNRGLAKIGVGDLRGALSDLDRTVALRRTAREAYYNRGWVKMELGDIPGAVRDYDEAINFKSDWADAYYNRGHAKEKLGDLDGANMDYVRSLEVAGKEWPNRGKAIVALNLLKKKP